MGWPHLTREQKQLARRLRERGLGLREIAHDIGSESTGGVCAIVNNKRKKEGPPLGWSPGPGRLTIEEREEILVGLTRGESMSSIARRLRRAPSTVTREVVANGGHGAYRAWGGHRRARDQARRPKPCKLDHARLQVQVTTWLEKLWSPQEIAERLRFEFPDDPMMQVSHETIYQSLFVQGRGQLRRELARCLRTGRATRKHRGSRGPPGPSCGDGHDLRASSRSRRPSGPRSLGR